MTFRTTEVKQMYFYNRQKLSFMYETDWGLSFNTALKAESNRPTGDLIFKKLPTVEQAADGTDPGLVNRIRTTEWSVGLRYCPGQTYINTKQQRLRHDATSTAIKNGSARQQEQRRSSLNIATLANQRGDTNYFQRKGRTFCSPLLLRPATICTASPTPPMPPVVEPPVKFHFNVPRVTSNLQPLHSQQVTHYD